MPETTARTVVEYQTSSGMVPFRVWFGSLRDRAAQARVDARIARLRAGNPGQTREVGEGVVELKIDFGPGYRVYFGLFGHEFVVLLAGGDKASQDKDINDAKSYWRDFKARNAPKEGPRKTASGTQSRRSKRRR